MGSVELLRRLLGPSDSYNRQLLSDDEAGLAEMIYNVAADEISLDDYADDDTISMMSFEQKVETTQKNFVRIVGLFKKTRRAKRAFLQNFQHWKNLRMENIEKMKKLAEAVRKDKYNGCIAKIVGSIVGIAGGAAVVASLACPPAAAITVPLAIAGGVASTVGGGVIAGTAGTELVLLKNKLTDSKTLIAEEEENFSRMTHWFIHSEELVDAMEELVGKDLLQDLMDVGKSLFTTVKRGFEKSNGDLQSILKEIMKKIFQNSNIVGEFGPQIAPIVISFILVSCIVSGKSRFVLNSALITQGLIVGFTGATDIGIGTGRLVAGLAMDGSTAAAKILPSTIGRAIALGSFVALGIALDVLNMVLASIEIHKGVRSTHADEINRVAELLESECSFLLSIYEEIKKYK